MGNINTVDIDATLVYITPLLVFPVDCFVFISGYYGIKLKRKTFISFLLLLIFYSVTTLLINSFLNGHFSFFGLMVMFFPVSTDCWWFFTVYIMLVAISPLLNKCSELDNKSFKRLLILWGFLYMGPFSLLFGTKTGCIGDLSLFIYIYMLGRYLKQHPMKFICNNRYFLLLITMLISILTVMTFYHLNLPSWIARAISYNNPMIIVIAISVFYIFERMKITSCKVINTVGSTVFASYLVTESSLRYHYINGIANFCGDKLWLYIISALVTVVLICPIEILRRKLFSGFIVRITEYSRTIIP